MLRYIVYSILVIILCTALFIPGGFQIMFSGIFIITLYIFTMAFRFLLLGFALLPTFWVMRFVLNRRV